MTRYLALALLFGVALVASTRPAMAQSYRGSSDNPVGPTVSPYLNLLSNNQFGVTNYQSLVRPLVQQGNAINRQGSELNRLQQQVGAQQRAAGAGGYGGSATGHATFFMNYSHFYPGASGR
jgi:hypothetical protein